MPKITQNDIVQKRILAEIILEEMNRTNLSTRKAGSLCHVDHMIFQRLKKDDYPGLDTLLYIANYLHLNFYNDDFFINNCKTKFYKFFTSFIIGDKDLGDKLYIEISNGSEKYKDSPFKYLYLLAIATYKTYRRLDIEESELNFIHNNLDKIDYFYNAYFYDICGLYFNHRYDRENSLFCFEKGISLSTNPVFTASLHFHLAKVQIFAKLYIQANKNASEAYNIFNDLKVIKRANHCLQLLTFIYRDCDDNKNALNIYSKLINRAIKYGDRKLLMDSYNNVLLIYYLEKDWKNAICLMNRSKVLLKDDITAKYCIIALLVCDQSNDHQQFNYWYNKLCRFSSCPRLYKQMGNMLYYKFNNDFKSAIDSGTAALSYITPDDEDENITILSTLSFCHKQLGNDEKALEYESMLNSLTSH